LDGDICGHWLHWHPIITDALLELFRACDYVACRLRTLQQVTRVLVDTPVFWLPEVATSLTLLSEEERIGGDIERPIILSPTAHCDTYNSHRSAMLNHAVMRVLAGRFDEYRYVVLSKGVGEAYSHTLGRITELGLTSTFGSQPEVWTGYTHFDLYELFRRTKLMVNLDYETTMGHWLLDAAAFGAPAVCSDFTSAGREVFDQTSVHPYNVDEAVEVASGLLGDSAAWERESARVVERVQFAHASQVRVLFEEGLGVA
jgi:hypothetical protein